MYIYICVRKYNILYIYIIYIYMYYTGYCTVLGALNPRSILRDAIRLRRHTLKGSYKGSFKGAEGV